MCEEKKKSEIPESVIPVNFWKLTTPALSKVESAVGIEEDWMTCIPYFPESIVSKEAISFCMGNRFVTGGAILIFTAHHTVS